MEHESSDWHKQVEDIADSLVIREGNVTLVTEQSGNIPIGNHHGYGLYHNDCRFLSGYDMKMNDRRLTKILSSDEQEYAANIIMTNRLFRDQSGRTIDKDTLSIRRERIVAGLIRENISITNYNHFDVKAELSFEFETDFFDMFTIRGVTGGRDGELEPPKVREGVIVSTYHGKDGHERTTKIVFDPLPDSINGLFCRFKLDLKARSDQEISIHIYIEDRCKGKEFRPDPAGLDERVRMINKSYKNTMDCCRSIDTDNRIFNGIFERSLADLRLLNMSMHDLVFHSAGVPWYDALFGRDAIISSIQGMPFELDIPRSTLKLLAMYQADTHSDWKDSEPGKILHEMRLGEKANLDQVPFNPYYGSVDSTPLFLILLAEYIDWTGDLDFFKELQGNVYRALEWMEKYSDPGYLGFASYHMRSEQGLDNQGWKDSYDSISRSDGSLAKPPIALAEVQGYNYMAKIRIAGLLDRVGDKVNPARLRREAAALKRDFNQRFWMEDKGYYAQAIDSEGLCDVISSNPLHGLWTGIIDNNRAKTIVERAFEPDMYSGWGIRTLSSDEKRYNPLGYHNGTVWPFDNSVIAMGLCKYGFKDRLLQLFSNMYDASRHYRQYRLPELLGGYSRKGYDIPVKYPVACSPQAWSSGSIAYMLTAALGLEPHAVEHELYLIKPVLPEWLKTVHIRRIKVGEGWAKIDFQRPEASTLINVYEKDQLDVFVHY